MKFKCKSERNHASSDLAHPLVRLLVNTNATGGALGLEACTFLLSRHLGQVGHVHTGLLWLCRRAGPGCACRGPRGGGRPQCGFCCPGIPQRRPPCPRGGLRRQRTRLRHFVLRTQILRRRRVRLACDEGKLLMLSVRLRGTI